MVFAECQFGPGGGSGSYAGGGIEIDAPGTAYSYIDQIRFVSCFSCLWYGPGLLIKGGTNFEVLGGYYSCNGNGGSPLHPYSPSGIAINGAVTGVRIANAGCNNSLLNLFSATVGPATATQSYGIYVGDGAAKVRIHGCDLTGNLQSGFWVDGSTSEPSNVFIRDCDLNNSTVAAVAVTTPVSNLQITGCPGYNDQNSVVASSGFTGTQSAAGAGYYGPSVLTWSTSSGVPELTLNGVLYIPGSAFGSVYLSLFDTIKLSAAPTTIHWLGK